MFLADRLNAWHPLSKNSSLSSAGYLMSPLRAEQTIGVLKWTYYFNNNLDLIRFLLCLVPFSLFVLGCGREVRMCMGWDTVEEGFIVCYSLSV